MKRSIIILIALVIFMAVPVLASTPEQENAPIADEEYIFLLDLTQLSEEQLINIFGLIATDNIDGTNTFNPFTQTGTTSDGKKFKIIKVKDGNIEVIIRKILIPFVVCAGLVISNLYKIADVLAIIGITMSVVNVTYVAGALIITGAIATVIIGCTSNHISYEIIYY